MKRGNKESGFIDLALTVSGVCAAVVALGLFVPGFRPLALKLGTGISFGVVAAGIGVLVYAGWRIAAYSFRSGRPAARARSAVATRFSPKPGLVSGRMG